MTTNDEIEKIIKDGTKGRNIDLGDIVVACELARADERAKMAERMKLIETQKPKMEAQIQEMIKHDIEVSHETAKQIFSQLRTRLNNAEARADFFYKDATDLANKNYERGYFDGIHYLQSLLNEMEHFQNEVKCPNCENTDEFTADSVK